MPTSDLKSEQNISDTAKLKEQFSPKARTWLMVAACCAMTTFGMVTAAPGVCLDSIGQELGLSFEQRGLLITARMITLMFALLLTGWLAARHGKRLFLVFGLLVMALGQVLGAISGGYVGLLGSQAAAGAGKGMMEALVNPLLAQLHPTSSARVLNLVNGLFPTGLVFGALITGEALQAGNSWRLPYGLLAIPATICGLLFLIRAYPPETGAQKRSANLKTYLHNRLFWLLFAGMIICGGCESSLTTWGPNFIQHELGASARGGAMTMVLIGVFMAAGRFSSGWILGFMSPITLMLLSAVGGAISLTGLMVVKTGWLGGVLFGLGGLFIACFWPTLLSVASERIEQGATLLFALLSTAGIIGGVIMPWGIGALGDIFGLNFGILLIPIAMLAQIFILMAVAKSTLKTPCNL